MMAVLTSLSPGASLSAGSRYSRLHSVFSNVTFITGWLLSPSRFGSTYLLLELSKTGPTARQQQGLQHDSSSGHRVYRAHNEATPGVTIGAAIVG